MLAADLLFASEWHLWATVAAGLIIQLLVGSKILDVDTNVKADRDLMWVPRTAVGLGLKHAQCTLLWCGRTVFACWCPVLPPCHPVLCPPFIAMPCPCCFSPQEDS